MIDEEYEKIFKFLEEKSDKSEVRDMFIDLIIGATLKNKKRRTFIVL